MAKSLQDFLNEVEEEVLDISSVIRPDKFEASALLEHLEERGEFPLVHFTNPLGIDGMDTSPGKVTLASNVFADRKRIARALGLPRTQYRMEPALEYARRERERVIPEIIKREDAPVKEVSHVEVYGEVDLRRLPIMHINEMDPAPYIDMANIMQAPPEDVSEFGKEFYNIAFLRTQYKGPAKLGIHMSPRHNHRIVQKNWENDRTTRVVIVAGHHPAFYLGALTLAAYGTNEYEVAGGMMQEPVRLVPSETWGSDFMVPADAEIIIEGEIPPHEIEAEAPFGEYPGYYGPQRMRPIVNVKNVTRRKNAILQTVFAGHRDHWLTGTLPQEGSRYNALKIHGRIAGLTAIHHPPSGCGRFRAYVSINKQAEGEGKMAALATLAAGDLVKHVIVVDDDIDVFNEEEVLWALSTRCRVPDDVDIIPGAKGNTLDPTVKPGFDNKNAKMIFDATIPFEYAYPARCSVPVSAKEDILSRWDDLVDNDSLKKYRELE